MVRDASDRAFLDAGILIGALLEDDPRPAEAYALVSDARAGIVRACTSVGVLSEVYAALTWVSGSRPQRPTDAARVVAKVVAPPSAIGVIGDSLDVALMHLAWASASGLTARRIHDARHAATALHHGAVRIYTYDFADWQEFLQYGLEIVGPASILSSPRAIG